MLLKQDTLCTIPPLPFEYASASKFPVVQLSQLFSTPQYQFAGTMLSSLCEPLHCPSSSSCKVVFGMATQQNCIAVQANIYDFQHEKECTRTKVIYNNENLKRFCGAIVNHCKRTKGRMNNVIPMNPMIIPMIQGTSQDCRHATLGSA